MTTAQLIVVGAAVFVAAFMQIVVGFGFALLAVPLMTLAIEPKIAVVVSSTTGIFVTSWQAYRGRAEADVMLVRRMTISAYVGMPLGLLVFLTVDDNVLRLLLGIAVLIAVVLLAMRVNLHHVGPRLDYGAGFISGVLNTSLSTNGPPLVFALQARQLSPATFRATISTVFALCNIGGLTLFIASGKITRDGLVAAAVTIPAMVIGQLLGFPIRKHIHGERFRWLVLVLLAAAAISAIVNAII
ncbi:MAG: sulfite exporter TauE/SafE family protein [Ilumatobacteraceae bacterium]